MSRTDLLEMTEHHCDPKSNRHHVPFNKVPVWRGIHDAWHVVMLTRSPDEALRELVRFWLAGQGVTRVYARAHHWRVNARPLVPRYQNSPTKLRAFNLIFPTERPLEIVSLWAWKWVPKEYLEELSVDIGQDRIYIPHDTPNTDLIAKIERRQERKLEELQARLHGR